MLSSRLEAGHPRSGPVLCLRALGSVCARPFSQLPVAPWLRPSNVYVVFSPHVSVFVPAFPPFVRTPVILHV